LLRIDEDLQQKIKGGLTQIWQTVTGGQQRKTRDEDQPIKILRNTARTKQADSGLSKDLKRLALTLVQGYFTRLTTTKNHYSIRLFDDLMLIVDDFGKARLGFDKKSSKAMIQSTWYSASYQILILALLGIFYL
jgi:hypothetical protein